MIYYRSRKGETGSSDYWHLWLDNFWLSLGELNGDRSRVLNRPHDSFERMVRVFGLEEITSDEINS